MAANCAWVGTVCYQLVCPVVTFPVHASLEGEFRHGVVHGTGTYAWPSGARYTGEWNNGSIHGVGLLQYADKCVYEGQFAHGLREGLGRFCRVNPADGDVEWELQGQWSRGSCHGSGTLTWANGDSLIGTVVLGRLHGSAVWIKHSTSEEHECQTLLHVLGESVDPEARSPAHANCDVLMGVFANGTLAKVVSSLATSAGLRWRPLTEVRMTRRFGPRST